MKTEAKNIKKGNQITQGQWSMLVNTVTNSTLKNGTPIIIVKGKVTNHGRKYNTDRTYKTETKINIL